MTDIKTWLLHIVRSDMDKKGTRHFWQQRITAVTNIPLTLFFLFTLVRNGGADYAVAKAWIGNPLVAAALLFFIFTALWHARLGMQVIIDDYIHHTGLRLTAILANGFFTLIVAIVCGLAIFKIVLT